MKIIPYSCQDIDENDIAAVVKVLKSDFLTQGPTVTEFEQKLSKVTGAKHVIAVASGTAALHLGLLALGCNQSSRVWTSPITFVASANCALYCDSKIDFIDIDYNTYNICLTELEKKLKIAKTNNSLPDVLIPVHLTGKVCDLEKIKALAEEYNFKILEDAAHALGAKDLTGSIVGNCKFSDLTIFSFHPVKSITTGEGGAILTNNDSIAKKLRLLRTHGITKEKNDFNFKVNQDWYYEQQHLGYHYRMTDIQAALGISQLDRLEKFVDLRKNIALRYHEKLKNLSIKTPSLDLNSAWHLYVVLIEKNRDQVYKYLRDNNIYAQVHYWPVPLQPYYQKLGFKISDYPNAEKYAKECLSLPIYTKLTENDQDYVVQKLSEVLS